MEQHNGSRMEIPAVSLIIAVYNVKEYLERCMNSLLNQTLKNIEYILVDDGSTDGSEILCDAYAKGDSRITVIHKQNAGLGMARNTGLKHARGRYVGFIDSDDYVLPEMFEVLYRAAEEEQADLVLSGARIIGGSYFEESQKTEEKYCFRTKETFSGQNGREKLALGMAGSLPGEKEDSRYGFSVWKNLYRRDIIEKEGLAFVSERDIISEDIIFNLDFISHISCAAGIPGAYYCYCRNGESLSKKFRPDRWQQNKKLVAEIRRKLDGMGLGEESALYLARRMQAYGRLAVVQEILHGSGRDKILDILSDPELTEGNSGRIWVGLVQDDGSLQWQDNPYVVNDGTHYAYSPHLVFGITLKP